MRLEIHLDLNNGAFSDSNQGAEVARILRKYADKCESAGLAVDSRLMDENGNTTGEATANAGRVYVKPNPRTRR